MSKTLHVVFPKDMMNYVLQELPNKVDFEITGKDYSLDTFHHYATGNKEIECDTVIVVDRFLEDVPIEQKAKEIITKVSDIRMARQNLRIILLLPSAFNRITYFKKQLVSLLVYDMYFTEEFSFEDIVKWLETPKTLNDMKEYIDFVTISEEQTVQPKAVTPSVSTQQDQEIQDSKEDSRTNRRQKRFTKEKVVVEKEIIEKVISVSLPQNNIAFVSLSRGAGSSFHAINYAAFLTEKDINVALYEYPVHYNGRTYLADHFDVFHSNELFISAPHSIQRGEQVLLNQVFKHGDISMYPVNYVKEGIEQFDADNMYRYLNTGRHLSKVFDLGYIPFNEDCKQILDSFDAVFVLVDLSPIQFLPNFERFEWLKEHLEHPSLHFILNPFVDSFPKSELKELGLKDSFKVPRLDYEEIMKSFFQKRIAYQSSDSLKEELFEVYEDMSIAININLPTSKKKKTGIFNLVGLF